MQFSPTSPPVTSISLVRPLAVSVALSIMRFVGMKMQAINRLRIKGGIRVVGKLNLNLKFVDL